MELAKAAELLLLALPGAEGAATVDAEGAAALNVLRAMGLPHVLGVVRGGAGAGAASMKERCAVGGRFWGLGRRVHEGTVGGWF